MDGNEAVPCHLAMGGEHQLRSARPIPVKRKWYSLYDKVFLEVNLRKAWGQVKANRGSGGVDNETIESFESNLDRNIQDLEQILKTKKYKPHPVKRVHIPKGNGKTRPLGIPTIRDRIVQQSLHNVLQPIFEPKFANCSYGFRPGRSAHQAIERIEEHLDAGYTWVVDADIKDFFGGVNHDLMNNALNEEIADGSVLRLIRAMLKAGVMEEGKVKTVRSGTPQGGVISPLLANIYLDGFDQELTKRGYRLVRYADDFVILCKNKNKAERVLEVVEQLLGKKRLKLSREKTRIVQYGKESFEFLGFWFRKMYGVDRKGPRVKTKKSFKKQVKYLTRRQQPRNLGMVIAKLNPVIRGWGNYFKAGDTKTLYTRLDSWIRMRLRSYVKKKRWVSMAASTAYPNRVLAKLGLVSLSELRSSA